MLVKIYVSLWALGILSAIILYISGNFNSITAGVFGFLTFAALFMGITMILPYTLTHAGQKAEHSK